MKLWNNCWKRTGKRSLSGAEAFLRGREPYCVGAASRFFTGAPSSIWMTGIEKGGPWEPRSPGEPGMDGGEGLLLYCRNLLFPVFRFSPRRAEAFRAAGGIPLPPFFSLTLAASPLHAVQGLTEDAALLEAALAKRRLLPSAVFDYELRSLENREPADYPGIKGPPSLVIRKPEPEDVDRLFPLQAAYEQEEVLPPGAAFDPAVCRRGLELLVAGNKILAAELDGVVAGKINVNAQSFTRFQIGGVYVLPQWRGLGIAGAMTAALLRELAPRKKDFTLFVKKNNAAARRVYDRVGFAPIGNYRIAYY